MNVVFGKVFDFFSSLGKVGLSYNIIFFFSIILFLLALVWVVISTSRAYEPRLVKVIDKLNVYFADNPQITEDNLIAFNGKMKSKKVPKQFRKCWQQFVLYREAKASEYMSFDNCVNKPIKNSTFRRDITTLNLITYIISGLGLLLNLFCAYEEEKTPVTLMILQEVFMGPVVLLLINLVVTIFLDIRHNAIVSDLYQNYQYFEVNIDKATTTLPEFIDYELLFDKNEIKKGIPILYTYLQKRAEEEKKELERARLKNIEHEKYNFEEVGVDGSLVLERAMQEAENYIAERKKLNQDVEQINFDMSEEDSNYREVIKEYNRQMQVSKETFENFKTSLEQADSSIQTNYLKKQQQQELDRQRNLERDFDLATERHKTIMEGFQKELEEVDKSRNESRESLENAMKSEFESYTRKVYDKVREIVEKQQEDKFNEIKSNVKELEETIAERNDKMDSYYDEENDDKETNIAEENQKLEDIDRDIENIEQVDDADTEETETNENFEDEFDDVNSTENQIDDANGEYFNEDENPTFEDDYQFDNTETEENSLDNQPEVTEEDFDALGYDFDKQNEEELTSLDNQGKLQDQTSTRTEEESIDEKFGETAHQNKHPGRPRKIKPVDSAPKRGRGRPKKEDIKTTDVERKHRGRPRKEKTEVVEKKRGRGRPKKVENAMIENSSKRPVGRPKKESNAETASPVKKRRGRPAKAIEKAQQASTALVKHGRGRPKKIEKFLKKSKRGRPKKISTPDIDSRLQAINDEIKKENEKMKQTQILLENQSKFNKKKRK